ncbi:MAG TPA: phage major capsid protein [Thermoleophilaceae bacterium]|nr:phage major capsid protein [Thermoleophilaceae bacterium]
MRSQRQQFTDLCEEERSLLSQGDAITAKADSEGRGLHPDEERKHDKIVARLDVVRGEMRTLQSDLFEDGPRMTREAALNARGHGSRDEEAIRAGVLRPEHRFVDWQATQPTNGSEALPTLAEAERFSLGRLLRGMATGKWDGADLERRVFSEGTDSAGGFLTPELLAAVVIDRVRNVSRVMEAGATTVPLTSDKQSIPRIAGSIAGGWRAENAAVTEDDTTFERVVFEPKAQAVLAKLSFELADDMIPAGFQAIENEIFQSLALELDRVALRGSGTSPEPKGIRNQSDVELQSLATNGATPTLADYITAVYGVRKDNLEPDATLWSARTGERFAKLTDTTNQPIVFPPEVADIPRLTTNQIPDNLSHGTATDASEIYVGKWDECLIGVRSEIRFQILRERFADNMQIGLLAHLRADVQLAHPKAFVVVTGVRP